jgi:hypothetical protein
MALRRHVQDAEKPLLVDLICSNFCPVALEHNEKYFFREASYRLDCSGTQRAG